MKKKHVGLNYIELEKNIFRWNINLIFWIKKICQEMSNFVIISYIFRKPINAE